MNWIERLYEIKNKDLYSQNGEGLILEAIYMGLNCRKSFIIDIGAGDGFHLSNSRHLENIGWKAFRFDRLNGHEINKDNLFDHLNLSVLGFAAHPFLSIDIDGNDYWIMDALFEKFKPNVVVAEFNPAFTDSRAIAYNPDHVWAGDNYYGFSFEAGKKLAEKHGYKVIFQLADMNIFMVRADLIEGLTFPEVTFRQNNFFKESGRTDWVMI